MRRYSYRTGWSAPQKVCFDIYREGYGQPIAKCDHSSDARKIVRALNHFTNNPPKEK